MFDTYRAEDIEDLAGARVLRVEVKDDTSITIFTDKGDFHLEADGDCCSSSFFLNPKDLEELVGQKLVSVNVRLETDGARDRSEDDAGRQEYARADENSQWYGADFNYLGGSVYLEMRNDSNGYYGGWCNVRKS